MTKADKLFLAIALVCCALLVGTTTSAQNPITLFGFGSGVDTNSGNKSAKSQRFVMATDQPQLTNAWKVDGSAVTQPVSGTVTANMGTVTADPFGANADAASATGSISAKLRFIGATGIPVTSIPGVGATGSAPPASANYLGGLVSGATGGFLGGVTACDTQAFLDMTTATTTELVALTSGRKVHVCYWLALANGTTVMTFKRGTGTNCGTGTASISPAWDLVTSLGFSGGSGLGEIFDNQTAANALCVTSSAAVNLHVYIRYAIY